MVEKSKCEQCDKEFIQEDEENLADYCSDDCYMEYVTIKRQEAQKKVDYFNNLINERIIMEKNKNKYISLDILEKTFKENKNRVLKSFEISKDSIVIEFSKNGNLINTSYMSIEIIEREIEKEIDKVDKLLYLFLLMKYKDEIPSMKRTINKILNGKL